MSRLPMIKKTLLRTLLLALFCLLAPALSSCSGVLGGNGLWQSGGLQPHNIQALIVDPNDPLKLYAGDVRSHVFATTDGGQHWSEQDTGLSHPTIIHAFAFSSNGKQLYVATDEGIYVSSDAAHHWRWYGVGSFGTIVTLVVISNTPDTLIVATASGEVLTSSDGGATWGFAGSGLAPSAYIHRLIYDPNTRQLWAATSRGVYRSDDQGTSWHAFTTGLPADVNVNTVMPAMIAGGAKGRIYAGTMGGFFISSDDGAHWTASHDSLARVSIQDILVDFRSTNVSTLYIGTSVGALRSDDSGDHWGGVASGIAPNTYVNALAIGGNGNSQLYAATSSDLYLYPGSGGGFDLARILAIGLAVLLFAGLYLLVSRGRRSRRELLKPVRIMEQRAETPEH